MKPEEFPYSDNQRPWHTYSYYLKTTFHRSVRKIPLQGFFTCPNRDGTLDTTGCLFCGQAGGGEHLINVPSVLDQYQKQTQDSIFKEEKTLTLPYFQANSNTYGPLEKIQALLEPFLSRPEVAALALATRPDCLEEEKLAYLAYVSSIKPLWLELGLQTFNDEVAMTMHRGYPTACFLDTLKRIRQYPSIQVCVHLINGYPTESLESCLANATHLNQVHPDAVKIHSFYLDRTSSLAQRKQPISFLTRDQYIELVCLQLQHLDPSIIIQRLTADPTPTVCLGPAWVLDKKKVLNGIDQAMRQQGAYQGCLL